MVPSFFCPFRQAKKIEQNPELTIMDQIFIKTEFFSGILLDWDISQIKRKLPPVVCTNSLRRAEYWIEGRYIPSQIIEIL